MEFMMTQGSEATGIQVDPRGALVASRDETWREITRLIQMLPADRPVHRDLHLQSQRASSMTDAIVAFDAGDYEAAKEYFASKAATLRLDSNDVLEDTRQALLMMCESYIAALEQLEQQRT